MLINSPRLYMLIKIIYIKCDRGRACSMGSYYAAMCAKNTQNIINRSNICFDKNRSPNAQHGAFPPQPHEVVSSAISGTHSTSPYSAD